MQSDIVERLLAANPSGEGPTTLEDEAAAEITALRERVAKLQDTSQWLKGVLGCSHTMPP